MTLRYVSNCEFRFSPPLPAPGVVGGLSKKVSEREFDDGGLKGWKHDHELIVIGYATFPINPGHVVLVCLNKNLNVTSTVGPEIFIPEGEPNEVYH